MSRARWFAASGRPRCASVAVKHEAAVLDLGRMTSERNALAANIDAKCALAAGAVLSDPLLLELLARGNHGPDDPVVDCELRERLTAIIADSLK